MTPAEIVTFITGFFALANPLILLGPFLDITDGLSKSERMKFLLTSIFVMASTYMTTIWIGSEVLLLLGVTTAMLNAAGGTVIIALAFPMVLGSEKAEKKTGIDEINTNKKRKSWRSKAVSPFGIPLLVGGGQIAYLIAETTQYPGIGATFAISVACLIVVAITWICLRFAVPISYILGDTGIKVISRLFGFILLAIGWSIFTKGLVKLLPGLAG